MFLSHNAEIGFTMGLGCHCINIGEEDTSRDKLRTDKIKWRDLKAVSCQIRKMRTPGL